jgi:C-terminal processing protease CtpA/Prc
MLVASVGVLAAAPSGQFGLVLNVQIDSVTGAVERAMIMEVLPDSPASEQRLTAGDQVIEIDGQAVAGSTLAALQSLIDKARHRALRFRLRRPNGDLYSAAL